MRRVPETTLHIQWAALHLALPIGIEPQAKSDEAGQRTMAHLIRVLICGAGSSAHVLAAVLSAKPEAEVRVLTLDATRAEAWQKSLDAAPVTIFERIERHGERTLTAGPVLITNDPAEAARDSDIILFAIPAFLHRSYLTALGPFIEDGCAIVGLPGQSGFEFEVRSILSDKTDRLTLMNFDSLPWVCRTVEFGKYAQISGTKEMLAGAAVGDFSRARLRDPLASLQFLLGERPKLVVSGHLLGITLRSPNGYSHPPIMYGRWKDWDGEPLEQPPLFYRDIDEPTAALLEQISGEVVDTSRQLMEQYPGTDLSQVIPMYEWDMNCYRADIEDKTNLWTALRTNAGYAHIEHPMTQTADGRYVPDFQHRFLMEDVPFGLVVVRSIAEIAGVPTPGIDEVLLWCQEKMGRQYLVNFRLVGRDIGETRCAFRYGLTTLEDILGYEPLLTRAAAQ